jgi:hypothetical protein
MDGGGPVPEDIIEQGRERGPRFTFPDWRPSRAAGILAVVALVVGFAVGYAAGKQQGSDAPATPRPAASPTDPPPLASPFYGPALTEETGTCSTQVGQDLELGVPITNTSSGPVLLHSAKPELAGLKLLKVLSWRWGPCGYDDGGATPDGVVLEPGETIWLTATVKPLVTCPTPAPVQFLITYSANRQDFSYTLPGFPDLGSVPYSGCKGRS